MNEPKTPNLGLNKIDRSSPSTTYFDLDKYLDQNWEKVDEGVGQVEEKAEETATQVSNIQERLDTEKRRSVTLEPGLQVVHAERVSAFKLEGLKGRTLVNLLGSAGGMESLTGLNAIRSNLSLDMMNKLDGSSGLKVTINSAASPSAAGVATVSLPNFKANSFYVLVANVKNGNSIEGATIGFGGDFGGPYSTFVQTTDKFVTVWAKKKVSTQGSGIIDFAVFGNPNQYGYFDSGRLYEISESEYNALDSMNPEQIAIKYPYVNSIQPVRNPYVIRYGENLLPPFYEWEHTGHTFLETSPHTATGELVSGSMGTDAYAVTYLSVLANQDYTISNPAASTGKIRVSVYDSYTRLQGMFINPGETKTIKTVSRAIKMGVNLSGVTQYTEEFDVNKWTWTTGNKASFAYPTMTLGKVVKPLKTREDCMLALQTDLYSDPVTGLNADEVFEKNGQYYKMTKWRKIILDESLRYRSIASSSGYKIVGCTLSEPVAAFNSLVVTKYNGNVLTKNGNMSESDNAYFRIADLSDFNVSIANADSGWGDSYTPTADEIKAYFMGWKMYLGNQGDVSKPYNGETVGKAWCPLDSIYMSGSSATHFTTTLPVSPTIRSAYTRYSEWKPYQLIYQLGTPTIEPITSEGQLTFNEGDNQVEVGTGMIIRESANPVYTSDVHKSYNINNYNLSAKLNSKVKKILSVYKNDVRDYWEILRFNPESEVYGLELASMPASQYDPSAYYTVTYQVQDQFSPISINGTIGVSEKSIIEQFINDSSNISRQLSVVESKNNEMELQKYADKNYLRKSSGISENQDLNGFVAEGEYYCQFNTTAETLKNCPVGVAFSLKVSKNGTQNKESIPGVTQTLITFLPVGFTTWQRNLYDIWGAWVQVPSREEFESLKSSVSDGKSAVAAAITGKGVVASGSDTFPQLATKINQINVGPKYATGTIQSAATSMYFMTYNGSYAFNHLSVSNLDFRPNKIIIRRTVQASGEDLNVYDYYTRAAAENSTGSNYNYYTFSNGQGRSAYIVNVYEYSGLGIPSSNAFVNSSGFRVPVLNSNTSYTWEAFRI
ncbi:pyocin knob domain-containing protein [Paenibacillus sp. ClWae2A]|uniref:pyocin knob domain-containing protein n=1 Tax=Paenibacillus sp. ClWae2A TaxID=3057177 RepID=UPI0028F6091A|nr:pyocin knob domain-containing protein [Paenibacillus sp. ClWae2A]MDT9721372.1 pyocin knob domain-containing protein [Paenibacillus sp. ClWae2A]